MRVEGQLVFTSIDQILRAALAGLGLGCCASPVYLKEHGTPRTPEELPAHRCVNFLSNRSGRVFDWQFERDGRKVRLTLDSVLAVNDHEAYVLAGVTGLGIVKVANYVVRPYLESGLLIEVLRD